MLIQKKPKTQGPQGECIGKPIPRGYPDAPRRRDDANHLVSKSSSVGQKRWCPDVELIVIVLVISLGFVGAMLTGFGDMNEPDFKIGSVSVYLERNNKIQSEDTPVTARWNIGFSVENPNLFSTFYYKSLDLYVLCMYPTLSVVTPAPFNQDPRNTTFCNATVHASLPHRAAAIREIEFKVIVRVKYIKRYRLRVFVTEGVCSGMRVEFSRNAWEGNMATGPTSCSSIRPLRHH